MADKTEDRLDRHGSHGLPHGRAAAQEGPRRLDLEPHEVQGRAAAPSPAARSSTSSPISRAATWCSPSSRPARTSSEVYFGDHGVTARPQQQPAEGVRRLLDHRGRGVRRHPQAAARRSASDFLACPVSGNAKVIKAGKLSAVASGPEALFQQVAAADRGVRAATACPTSATASSRASARSRTT